MSSNSDQIAILPIRLLCGFAALVCAGILNAEDPAPEPAERTMASFEFLFARSPFSLPTAEESSPLADRYALTGAAAWGGEQRVFILDRTSQQRHVVSQGQGGGDMLLLEFLPEVDPRQMRARVQIAGQVATLAFAETPAAAPVVQPPNAPPVQPGASVTPGTRTPAIATGAAPGQQPVRRSIIRRRSISGVPPPPE